MRVAVRSGGGGGFEGAPVAGRADLRGLVAMAGLVGAPPSGAPPDSVGMEPGGMTPMGGGRIPGGMDPMGGAIPGGTVSSTTQPPVPPDPSQSNSAVCVTGLSVVPHLMQYHPTGPDVCVGVTRARRSPLHGSCGAWVDRRLDDDTNSSATGMHSPAQHNEMRITVSALGVCMTCLHRLC